jgi:hypothetical protein
MVSPSVPAAGWDGDIVAVELVELVELVALAATLASKASPTWKERSKTINGSE